MKVEEDETIHVIDFSMSYGVQTDSLQGKLQLKVSNSLFLSPRNQESLGKLKSADITLAAVFYRLVQ